MTRKQAARSLIAYLDNYGPSYPCKHGHVACAVRNKGVCIDEVIATYPDLGDLERAELFDVLREPQAAEPEPEPEPYTTWKLPPPAKAIDIVIAVLERPLSDGSLVYDVRLHGPRPEAEMLWHACTMQDATQLAEKIAAAIDAHTVHKAALA